MTDARTITVFGVKCCRVDSPRIAWFAEEDSLEVQVTHPAVSFWTVQVTFVDSGAIVQGSGPTLAEAESAARRDAMALVYEIESAFR